MALSGLKWRVYLLKVLEWYSDLRQVGFVCRIRMPCADLMKRPALSGVAYKVSYTLH